MNGHVIPVVRIGSIWSSAPFLGGILESGVGSEIQVQRQSRSLRSNLYYETICRVILLSITWSTHWGGRDSCLNFPLGENEHMKVECYTQRFSTVSSKTEV